MAARSLRLLGGSDSASPCADPPLAAARQTMTHAEHFTNLLWETYQAPNGGRSLVCSPYDAELFGHWWFEGPQFLEQVFRNLDARNDVVATTPPAYLAQFDMSEIRHALPAAAARRIDDPSVTDRERDAVRQLVERELPMG